MRQWTQKERERQAALIQKWKPWQSSTGPKTINGKCKSSKNALIHGCYSFEAKKSLRFAREIIKEYRGVLSSLSDF